LNKHKSFPKEAKRDVLNSKEVVDMNEWKRREETKRKGLFTCNYAMLT
jgi:hypothetical protein